MPEVDALREGEDSQPGYSTSEQYPRKSSIKEMPNARIKSKLKNTISPRYQSPKGKMGNSATPFNRRQNERELALLLPSIDKSARKRFTGKGLGPINNDPLS